MNWEVKIRSSEIATKPASGGTNLMHVRTPANTIIVAGYR